MTQARSASPLPALLSAVGAVLILTAVGCSGPRMTPEEAIKQVRPVVMKGESAFLGGDILATITVSRGFQREQLIGRRGFRQTDAEQIIERIQELNPEDKTFAEDVGKLLKLEVRGSRMPPVTATLRLTNRTTREIEVQIADFNSELGNFAVQPGKVKLAAGETVEVEPMTSQLGVASDTIPVKVNLKTADKSDAHNVDVKSILVPAPKK